MRITHVITRLIVGGAQENTIATVLGLAALPGVTVDLISGPTTGPEGSLEDVFSSRPQSFQVLPSLVRPVRPLADLQAFFHLTRIFRGTKPDLVHTHSGKAGIVGRFAAARAQVPIIVHTIHGPSFGPWQGAVANSIFRGAERSAAKATTHFIAVAGAMIEQYLAAGISTRERYSRIPSGFALAPFLAAKNQPGLRARYKIEPGDIVIGKIARLFALKGHDALFAAAPEIVKAFPKVKFLLVGGGQWEERFRLLARSAGLEKHFVFTGLVPPAQIPSLIGIMDILAHLSLREGLARALPQALAAGKPVVAFDCDGASEVCIDQQTGFLLPPGNVGSVAAAVIKLAGDTALRARLGETGRALVKEQFPVEKMVSDIYKLYRELAQAGERRRDL